MAGLLDFIWLWLGYCWGVESFLALPSHLFRAGCITFRFRRQEEFSVSVVFFSCVDLVELERLPKGSALIRGECGRLNGEFRVS